MQRSRIGEPDKTQAQDETVRRGLGRTPFRPNRRLVKKPESNHRERSQPEMKSRAMPLAARAVELFDRADKENRSLTPEERKRVGNLLDLADQAKSVDVRVHDLEGDFTDGPRGVDTAEYGGPGDIFVNSDQYNRIKSDRGQQFSTGQVQVADRALSAKGTLLESTTGGPGGGLTPPGYEAGAVQTLFQPLNVASLFATSQTNASQIRYVVEGTATNAAAGVAEAGVKPESELGLSEVSEPIKKVATVLPVSDELLEDAGSIRQYLNSRLALFVSLEEERQLLRGAGTNELVGVFSRSISTYAAGTVDNNAIAILKAAAGVRGSAFLEPDAIILHPDNWLVTRLLTDTAGQFLGGGPFTGPYGSGQQVATSQFSAASLWGLRVVTSTTVGAGTALLGSFGQGAHIWRRGGVNLEASNSHEDYFTRNLVSLRAESRLGLGVLRPASFVQVIGLD